MRQKYLIWMVLALSICSSAFADTKDFFPLTFCNLGVCEQLIEDANSLKIDLGSTTYNSIVFTSSDYSYTNASADWINISANLEYRHQIPKYFFNESYDTSYNHSLPTPTLYYPLNNEYPDFYNGTLWRANNHNGDPSEHHKMDSLLTYFNASKVNVTSDCLIGNCLFVDKIRILTSYQVNFTDRVYDWKENLSVSAWVKLGRPSSEINWQPIFSTGGNNINGLTFSSHASTNSTVAYIGLMNSTGGYCYEYVACNNVVNGTDMLDWHSYSATWQNATIGDYNLRAWVDGIRCEGRGTTCDMGISANTSVAKTFSLFVVGDIFQATPNFNGSIDEIAVWNGTALTDEMAMTYYRQGVAGQLNITDGSVNFCLACNQSGWNTSRSISSLTGNTLTINYTGTNEADFINGTIAYSYTTSASYSGNWTYTNASMVITAIDFWVNHSYQRLEDSSNVKYPISLSGLVYYGHMDGNAKDFASPYNNVVEVGITPDTDGIVNTSLKLAGVGSWINVTTSGNADTFFTLIAWVNADHFGVGTAPDRDPKIFARNDGGGGNGRWALSVDTTTIAGYNRVQSFIGGTAVLGTTNISEGQWYQIAVRYNSTGNNVSVFTNGNYENSITETDEGAKGDWIIGNWRSPSLTGAFCFNGSIDEVLIFNRTLSDAEIKQTYEAGLVKVNKTYTPNSAILNLYTLNKSVTPNVINASITYTLTIDNPPNITTNLTDMNITYSTLDIQINASDDIGLINISRIINGVYNFTNSSGLINGTYTQSISLSDGYYNISFEACDNSSQCTSTANYSIGVDTTPPAIPSEITNLSLTSETCSVSEPFNITAYFGCAGAQCTGNYTFNISTCTLIDGSLTGGYNISVGSNLTQSIEIGCLFATDYQFDFSLTNIDITNKTYKDLNCSTSGLTEDEKMELSITIFAVLFGIFFIALGIFILTGRRVKREING